ILLSFSTSRYLFSFYCRCDHRVLHSFPTRRSSDLQHYNGKPIDPGTQLPRGSVIDLLVGRGLSNETTPVPNLLGMTVREAQKQAQSLYLNIGAIVMEEGIDSSAAFIYRQIPSSGRGQVLNLGASIDVWLTDDTSMHPDSLIIYDSFPEDDLGGDEDFDNEFF